MRSSFSKSLNSTQTYKKIKKVLIHRAKLQHGMRVFYVCTSITTLKIRIRERLSKLYSIFNTQSKFVAVNLILVQKTKMNLMRMKRRAIKTQEVYSTFMNRVTLYLQIKTQ